MGNVQTAKALDVLWRPAPSGELLDLGRIYRGPLALSRLHSTPKRILSRREAVLLGVFALVLHGAVIYFVNQNPPEALPVKPPEIPPMTIEFSQPAPPVVETPPPPPEPPQQQAQPPPGQRQPPQPGPPQGQGPHRQIRPPQPAP